MDQMLASPSFTIPSIGTPHHSMALEEDQMIAPQAQEAQQQNRSSNLYSFGEISSL
jgi:transcription initiation factor TFIID TATA-box-binding protein